MSQQMRQISPHVIVKGRVRAVSPRAIAAIEARDEVRDAETGAIVTRAREAREGYNVFDLLVDTDPGGIAPVLLREEVVERAHGVLPAVGDEVELPCIPFVQYHGTFPRRYPVASLSVAGDAYSASSIVKTAAKSASHAASVG